MACVGATGDGAHIWEFGVRDREYVKCVTESWRYHLAAPLAKQESLLRGTHNYAFTRNAQMRVASVIMRSHLNTILTRQ